MLQERLELDISEAQRGIDLIEGSLGSAAQSFKVALSDALNVLSDISVSVGNVDAGAVTSGINEAVAAADATPTVAVEGAPITDEIDKAIEAVDATVKVEAATEAIAGEVESALAGTDATVTVQADTSTAESEINAIADSGVSVDVPVTADTSEAESEIAAVGDHVEPVDIPVTADTSEATSAIEQTSAAASDLGDSGSKGADGLKALSETAGLATGSLSGAEGAVAALNPELAAGAAAAVGFAKAGDVLFEGALQQQTAMERLNRTFGDTAGAIEHVNLGGINEDLDKLAVRTGANVDGLRNFAASFGLLGQSAGKSNPQIAETVNQITLLAERASVLNPGLGSADDIVNRLSTSLARGGRFLGQFGIALSAAQVNAEALRETGKTTAAELTQYEKSAAGAALATQQLGDKLGSDINTGAQSAVIRMRALKAELEETFKSAGAPLIAPIIDALHSLEPVIGTLAKALGVTLTAAVQAVGPELRLLGVIASGLGTVFDSTAGQVIGDAAVIGGAFAFFGPIGAIAAAAGIALEKFGDDTLHVSSAAQQSLQSLENQGAAMDKIVVKATEATVGSGHLSEEMNRLGISTNDVSSAIQGGGESLRALDDRLKAGGAGAGELRIAVNLLGDAMQEVAKKQLDALVSSGKLDQAQVGAAEAVSKAANGTVNYVAVLTQLGPQQAAVAAASVETGQSIESLNAQYEQGQTITKEYAFGLKTLAQGFIESAVSGGELTASQAGIVEALNTNQAGVIDYGNALKEIDPAAAAFVNAQALIAVGLDTVHTRFLAAAAAANLYKEHVDETSGPIDSELSAHAALTKAFDEATGARNTHTGSIDKGITASKNSTSAAKAERDATNALSDAELKLTRDRDIEIPRKLADAEDKVTKSRAESEKATRSESDAAAALQKLQDRTIPEELAKAEHDLAQQHKAAEDAVRAESDARDKLRHLQTVDLPRELEQAQLTLAKSDRDLEDANQGLADSQEKLNSLTRDYAENLDKANISAERANLRQADAADRVVDLQNQLAKLASGQDQPNLTAEERARAIAKLQREIASAQLDVRDAANATTDANRQLNDLQGAGHQREVATAMRGVQDAQDRITAAVRGHRDAALALNELENGGQQRQLADAERALGDAHDRAAQAADDERAKQQELNDLQDTGIPKQLSDANQALADARVRVSETATAASRAEQDLNDAQSANGPLAQELEKDQRAVADAEDKVTTSALGATVATDKLAASSGGAATAGKTHEEALAAVDQAATAYTASLIAAQEPQATINASIEDHRTKLEALRQKYPELTPVIDGLIAKLGEVKPPPDITPKVDVQEALDHLDSLHTALANLLKDTPVQDRSGPIFHAQIDAAVKQDSEFKLGGAVVSDSNPLPVKFIGPHAMAGGDFRAGQNVLVGEVGPEILQLHAGGGGTVIPNSDLGSFGSRDGWVLNSQSATPGISGADIDRLAAAVAKEMAKVAAQIQQRQPMPANFHVTEAFDAAATADAIAARLGFQASR